MNNIFNNVPGMMNVMQFLNLFISNMGFHGSWDIIRTIIDISIVSYLVYAAILLLRETRAWQLIKGILVIIVVAKLSDYIGLKTIAFMLNHAVQYIAIALVVLFQPELRRMLEQIGRNRFKAFFNFEEEDNTIKDTAMIEEIVKAVSKMSQLNIGAIIVVERETKIGEIITSGIQIDSNVTSELIANIFTPNTPLHDGAMIIRNRRIKAAGCFLPLTDNGNLSKGLGTRHRAAIGVSEVSDSVAVIVSEETGTISIALAGGLTRDLTPDMLRKSLHRSLLQKQKAKVFHKKLILWKVREK